MKSSVAVALAASFIPFVLASPYHMIKHAERDVRYEVEYVTDVQVATQYAEVTEYWTGEPAATETVTYSAPETTSVVETSAAAQTTESARARQHAEHTHQSSVVYTIQKTTTPEVAPTTTSTSSVAPAPAPTTTSTSTPAPESMTTPVFVAPTTVAIPTSVFTVAALPTTTSTPVVTSAVSTSTGLAAGAADYTALPVYTVSGYVATGTDSWNAANMQAAVIQSTNEMRAKWGADPVVWDDDLASAAQAQLAGCGAYSEHAGQNSADGSPGFSPTDFVNMWSSEAAEWKTSTRDGFSSSTGHFTQLVWKATTKTGCGARLCGDSRTLLCSYDPVGNMGDASQNSYVDSQGRKGSYALNVNSTPVY